ncbi:MAG TPA: peptide chain release factor N(5)-glutamine methyltransferase [Sphingopyxis sp.]|nr:peptide chain release factor N(5)-glutamine methyltransferase [Sphingopyxis sp.]
MNDKNRAEAAWPSDTGAALRQAAALLAPISDTARLDAELLLAHALGIERDRLLLDPSRYQTPAEFPALLQRRLRQEPLAYILGYRDFWTLRLAVGPGALIPRPDSETLIEALLEEISDRQAPLRMLDLGTGPGTLLLAALSEYPAATGLGVDASAAALAYAEENAAAAGLVDRAQFQIGDWGQGLSGPFDLILCNPPYIAESENIMADVADYEPASALFAGADGLSDYRLLMPQIDQLLSETGIALLEIGSTQYQPVAAMARECGFAVQCYPDLGGRDRAVLLRRN